MNMIELWQEWTVPANVIEIQQIGDLSIYGVNVVPDEFHKRGERSIFSLDLRVCNSTQFMAPIAMLMDAHVAWEKFLATFEKISPHERTDPTRLRAPILIGRRDYIRVRICRADGSSIDDDLVPKFQLCVRAFQMRDVR